MWNLQFELKRFFGYEQFRTGQKEIISDVLKRKNVLAMLPTGTGKSICYQLPALLLPGSTIVVSPLLSLMEDQVQQLKSSGIKSVVAINSFLSLEERKIVLKRLQQYKLIYVSPEILQSDLVRQTLKRIYVSLFVIDEAHCISQWGHDFRTDYLKLYEVITELHHPPCLAITATATKRVQEDIIEQLRLTQVKKRIYSVDRTNIALQVIKTDTIAEKEQKMIELIQKLTGPGMIYFSSRKWAERMTQQLKSAGIEKVAFYHGGMENDERMLIQQQFLAGELEVICCTSAFGMGINKPDVRYVIHFHYPGQIESYLQEIGRAGRDGKKSIAILFDCLEDAHITSQIIEMDLPQLNELKQVLMMMDQAAKRKERIHPDWEQQLMFITNISETKWRFIRYHLLELGIISEGKINRFPFATIFHTLEKQITDRLEVKRNQRKQMEQWLQTTTCRRSSYLKYFDEQKDVAINNCCDLCGIQIETFYDYREKPSVTSSHFHWKTELKRLFHQ